VRTSWLRVASEEDTSGEQQDRQRKLREKTCINSEMLGWEARVGMLDAYSTDLAPQDHRARPLPP